MLPGWAFPAAALRPVCHLLGGIPTDTIPPPETTEAADVLGGWSLGGLRTLEALSNDPSRWRAGILIAATARFTAAPDWPGQPPAALRALQRQLVRDPSSALAGFHQLAAPLPPPPAILAARVAASLAQPADILAEGLRTLATLDLRARLPLVPMPILVLHGAADRVIPVAAAHRLSALLPRAVLYVHPHAAHDLPLSHPAWVADAIAAFLRELP